MNGWLAIPSAIATWAAAIVAALVLLLLAWASLVSWREEERRAALVALGLALLLPLPLLAAALLPFPGHVFLAGLLVSLVTLAVILLAVPWQGPEFPGDDRPLHRIDERTIMFSRALLTPGSERFVRYYAEHPDHREPDERFRALPGLLQPGSTYHDLVQFAAADSSFTAIGALQALVEGEAARARLRADPETMTRFVLAWARKLGAVSAGVTELREEHFYSMVGRGPDWGAAVARGHRFGIAVTVEMDRSMIGRAPAGPTVMESAQQYLASGAIAVQLAELCRRLGWPARAHVDGNYRVVCPLVAKDAGLGEIGRMGLLMTPELGPRVRIAVVTTDLPLLPARPRPAAARSAAAMLDFCRICRKCADACPAAAIPVGDPRPVDGVRRWRIDQEACYTYWCRVGTDCARCVRICPFSHPDTSLHRLIRRGVARNAPFRRLALRLDDLLYGRRPRPLPVQRWLRVRSG
jgi:ferredoxin